ncbi:terminase small subunit [Lactococcus lactis]
MGRLKDKRKEDFAKEFAKSGNLYQSALSAGYSESYAKSQSYKLLENVGISERIKEVHAEIEKKLIERSELEPPMSDEELLSILYSVARRRPFKGKSMVSVTQKGKTNEKTTEYQYSPTTEEQLAAVDKLARIRGMYSDKLELEGNMDLKVVVDYGDDDENEAPTDN